MFLLLGTVIAPCPAGAQPPVLAAPVSSGLVWSTYLGGAMAAPRRVASPIGPTNAVDQARDVAVDSQGNIYVAGGARTTDFPHTIGPAHAGDMDGFVAKFSPTGALLWSRLIGGPNYERLYGIEVRPGDDNEIVICGRGGPNLPTQACASCGGQLLDASFNGDIGAGPTYGPQDGWVAKLDGAGNILWLSYFGDDSGDIIRDCDIDPDGYVYVAHTGLASASPALGTTGAYRATPNGGVGPDALIAKIDPLGRAVIWATYVGGTAADGGGPSLRVHADGTVYATMHTESSDFPLVNPVDNHIGGARDFGIVRIAADGGSLLFSSYLGGSGSTEWSGTHNLAIDAAGNLYLCAETDSTDFPGTAGFFQPNNAGGTDHIFAKVKVTPPTAILAATYVGGPGTDGELQGCAVDAEGNVLAASASRGSGAAYPTTSDAIQKNPDGGSDAVVVQLAADFLSLRYATYIGGSGDDEGRAGALIPGGFVTVGATRSPDFVVANAYQVTFSDTASHDPDAYVSVFSIGAATNTVTPTPTPTDTGSPTRTRTPSRTATRSSTPTITAIPSRTATPSSTRTSSKASPSPTPSLALPTTTATAPSTATPPVTPATTEPAASPSPAQTRTAIAVVGDVNGDGHRDSGDLDALIEALFEPAPPPTGDLDGDSRITSADLLMLLRLLSA